MRSGIEIRTAFAPTRMSAAHLRAAYELVSPVVERAVVEIAKQVAAEFPSWPSARYGLERSAVAGGAMS
jgi:hypothetical protein